LGLKDVNLPEFNLENQNGGQKSRVSRHLAPKLQLIYSDIDLNRKLIDINPSKLRIIYSNKDSQIHGILPDT
jgi:hypothetical protein